MEMIIRLENNVIIVICTIRSLFYRYITLPVYLTKKKGIAILFQSQYLYSKSEKER